jgi:hypothetical protein
MTKSQSGTGKACPVTTDCVFGMGSCVKNNTDCEGSWSDCTKSCESKT